jgi:hypothetical protein
LPSELGALERQLDKKFADDFETRRRRLEEHLAAGLGGARNPDRYGGHGAPSSPADLTLFLSEGERMKAIYGDRPEVATLCDVARTMPRVSLHLDEATKAATGSAPAHAWKRAIDPLLGTREVRQELDDLPIKDLAIPPGNWRFVVEIPGFGFAECTRYLLPRAETYDLEIRVRRDEAVQKGMKAIEAGRYKFDEKRKMACDIAGPYADFEAFWIDEAEVSNGEFISFLKETGRRAPQRWLDLNYKSDWHELPIGDIGDRFLELPIAYISIADAEAYAEWAGKRLPTHLELERALRGSESRLFPAGETEFPASADNYNVYGPDSGKAIFVSDHFALYLASVKPVRDRRYRQPPDELFHAFGNVAEVTESLLAEPEDGDVLAIKIWERVALGAAWDAKETSNALNYHATRGVSERYTSSVTGLRCCKSRSP